jgi:predicted negative regulator of RcsB-dependent stress response
MADDYLSDREQEEALRNWWRENWRWIMGGIVLGVALLAGWRYLESYKTQQAAKASELYQQFQTAGGDAEKAKTALDRLTSDYESSPYALQARLLQAKADADAARYEEAAAQLRAVVDSVKDEELAQIARLRLAKILIQQEKYDDALSLLKPETAGAFTAQVREIRGDALFAKGNLDGARAEYAAALEANADAQTDRALLEMKVRQTGGDTAPAETQAATN